MERARFGNAVKVHYTCRIADGTIFLSTEGGEPLSFTIGHQGVMPGMHSAVIGMTVGSKKTVTIPAAMAFGHHRPELVIEADRARFADTSEPRIGTAYRIDRKDGSSFLARVAGLTENGIVLDANHPLSGRDIILDIELVSVCAAPAHAEGACSCGGHGEAPTPTPESPPAV